MTQDKLKRANELSEQISTVKAQIKRVGYTQVDEVVPRKIYISFNGIDEKMYAPESLFKIIGKLILSEHQQDLIRLEKEFENL